MQQYDRVVNGQDKVTLTARTGGLSALQSERRTDGLRLSVGRRGRGATALGYCRRRTAPRGGAAFHGLVSRRAWTDRRWQMLYNNSLRPDVPPPPGGVEAGALKVLLPTDWNDFRADPPTVRARVGQDHRPALNPLRVAAKPHLAHMVMPLVVLLCGVLVLYPIGYLIDESLNAGDPSQFPPEQYGVDNLANLIDDAHISATPRWSPPSPPCWRSCSVPPGVDPDAHQHARPPGSGTSDGMPYYMTPLVGALAWGVLLGPQTGLINQVWRAIGMPATCSTSTRRTASPG